MNKLTNLLLALGFLMLVVNGADKLPSELAINESKSLKELDALIKNFSDLLVVDFFAEWCPSCKEVEKSLLKLEGVREGKIKLVKVDFSKSQDMVKSLSVNNVPTVLFYDKGKEVFRLEGMNTINDYQRVANDILAKGKVGDDFKLENKLSKLDITVKEAKELLSHSKPLLLDVRTRYEYRSGHLQASLLIPVQELMGRMSELSQYKDKNVIVYCHSGARSANACKILAKKGYKVFNVAGGISAWQRSGYKVVK
ncbi:MAG: thioredoxin fold domain-containing protein [Planctomycetes bacterium]|nr:thioredoxin fold domain-containing protein [Planctomycetota bacterium]